MPEALLVVVVVVIVVVVGVVITIAIAMITKAHRLSWTMREAIDALKVLRKWTTKTVDASRKSELGAMQREASRRAELMVEVVEVVVIVIVTVVMVIVVVAVIVTAAVVVGTSFCICL